MGRSKYILIFIFSILCSANLTANHKFVIYQAFISNNMARWKLEIDEMNLQKVKSNEFLLELLNYQYGYIGWCVVNKQSDLAEKYLDLAEKNVETLSGESYRLSYVNAYKSAFYGYRIALNKFKAPFLGSKSTECSRLAMKLDDKNPYGYIQYGNSQYFMPAMFGGSKTVALKYFKIAEDLMERDKDQLKYDWNYLSLLSYIAQAFTSIKDYESAKFYYQKILAIEPGYIRVKNELLPGILKMIENKE